MIPLSLYIHFPWCLKKCPYCDFNSYQIREGQQDLYVEKILQDLQNSAALVTQRELISIFFGGGTPSLLKPFQIEKIINAAQQRFSFIDNIEITLEANPGTLDEEVCKEFATAGINRISLGVQSFNEAKLVSLCRIHDRAAAIQAINKVKNSGIKNFNLDLMYGLPDQNCAEALEDLQTALSCIPNHISWYQLTLEPETIFAKQNILLPEIDYVWEMQQAGEQMLESAGYQHYEVSAYAKPAFQCRHNINYWEFGDYLGIGAGAHSKITHQNQLISRIWKHSVPEKYLQAVESFVAGEKIISFKELPFEFMLNALRLYKPIPFELFYKRTGLHLNVVKNQLDQAVDLGFIELTADCIIVTKLGHSFLNELLEIFLGSDTDCF